MEKTKGTADMQAQLAQAQVGVEIKAERSRGPQERRQGRGHVRRAHRSGRGDEGARRSVSREAKATEALGLARAIGFEAQTKAFGSGATAVVAVANAVSEGHLTVVPEVLVTGGGGGGGPSTGSRRR